MRFYFDTEFNGFGGAMLSAGLVREDGESLYLIVPDTRLQEIANEGFDPWVVQHIIPILHAIPMHVQPRYLPEEEWGRAFSDFIYPTPDARPQIIIDWPSDAMDFCRLLMTGPGTAVPMSNQTHLTILRHIDVYPTSLEGAVQHNAWWDAMALRQYVMETER